MKRLLIMTSLGASALIPAAAQAQALPAAVVAVVDIDRVRSTCNACKTAIAALQSQATAQETREKSLIAPLQTEQQSIQAAVNALAGKEPDAALQARAKAFQTKYEQAQEQAARGRQQLQANQQYIVKQIDDKMNPIFAQVMQRRGANVMVEQGATLATAAAIDVTNDVLAALNTALTTIQTNAPAATTARPNQPQGR
jgi:Skp family chaperone for outer membrane proteins